MRMNVGIATSAKTFETKLKVRRSGTVHAEQLTHSFGTQRRSAEGGSWLWFFVGQEPLPLINHISKYVVSVFETRKTVILRRGSTSFVAESSG